MSLMTALAEPRIKRMEAHFGVPLDYVRYMARHAMGALRALGKTEASVTYRHVLPRDPYHIARLVADQVEDCGTCLQLVVNVALKDGVSPKLIQAALDGDLANLPLELVDVYHFANRIANREDAPDLRDRLKARYGDEAFIELALAIAAPRVYPTLKRALGYAIGCSRVEVRPFAKHNP